MLSMQARTPFLVFTYISTCLGRFQHVLSSFVAFGIKGQAISFFTHTFFGPVIRLAGQNFNQWNIRCVYFGFKFIPEGEPFLMNTMNTEHHYVEIALRF